MKLKKRREEKKVRETNPIAIGLKELKEAGNTKFTKSVRS